jgi:hypothetical protein
LRQFSALMPRLLKARNAARKAFETVAQDLITAPDKKSDPIINSD